jgi:hypothetical protein
MPQIVEKFKSEVVLTLVTGILVPNGRDPGDVMQDIKELAQKIVGYPVSTHHLVDPEIYKAASEFVRSQHPDFPKFGDLDGMDKLERLCWLNIILQQLGPEVTLTFETKEEENG